MTIRSRKCFWGVERGQWVELTTLKPSVSRLSRQCGILNILQPYRPPRPVTGIALLYYHRVRVPSGAFSGNVHAEQHISPITYGAILLLKCVALSFPPVPSHLRSYVMLSGLSYIDLYTHIQKIMSRYSTVHHRNSFTYITGNFIHAHFLYDFV
jgi:hypothetical protein